MDLTIIKQLSNCTFLTANGFMVKWWLEILIFSALLAVILYISTKNYHIKHYSKSKYLEQQKSIRIERQRISSEIHDEVGAGISAIKLYAELASKKRTDVEEIQQINLMINELAVKINEVVWSTNAESDTLESLVYYIEEQTRKLFAHSAIAFEASIPQDIPEMVVNSQSRRNCYLIIKEVAHNTLKHSQASKVKLKITINEGLLLFTLKDNGIGFDPNISKINSMGLANIKLRIEKLKGSLVIENYNGTVILIKIPLEENIMPGFKPKKKRWYGL